MNDAIRKAGALIEALPYLRRFRDRLIVIKLGGSAMEDVAALDATLQDVVFMATVGLRPVLVHGGGKPIDRAMNAAGLVPRKVQGRRYTDDATLDIVVRVLIDEINADILRRIRSIGGRAIGLHRPPLPVLFGKRLMLDGTDLGHVGRVTRVDTELLATFCAGGVVPVIPSVAISETGGWLNVNADTAAAAVAVNSRAEKLVFLSDTPGILRDRSDASTLISHLDAARCDGLIRDGIIDSGMIPKVEACLDALRGGVGKTHMIDGRLPHSLLLEIYTDHGVGTEIVLEGTGA
ncbi:MAG: acetylglutamate kinase [Planctomycetia bacterium]|nr:acetylglutamate kinase [Planctomycetia bacterium]